MPDRPRAPGPSPLSPPESPSSTKGGHSHGDRRPKVPVQGCPARGYVEPSATRMLAARAGRRRGHGIGDPQALQRERHAVGPWVSLALQRSLPQEEGEPQGGCAPRPVPARHPHLPTRFHWASAFQDAHRDNKVHMSINRSFWNSRVVAEPSPRGGAGGGGPGRGAGAQGSTSTVPAEMSSRAEPRFRPHRATP